MRVARVNSFRYLARIELLDRESAIS